MLGHIEINRQKEHFCVADLYLNVVRKLLSHAPVCTQKNCTRHLAATVRGFHSGLRRSETTFTKLLLLDSAENSWFLVKLRLGKNLVVAHIAGKQRAVLESYFVAEEWISGIPGLKQ